MRVRSSVPVYIYILAIKQHGLKMHSKFHLLFGMGNCNDAVHYGD